ncbi:MAG: hypothetical protein ABSA03_18885 [Streptosporangiaceae bacterium]
MFTVFTVFTVLTVLIAAMPGTELARRTGEQFMVVGLITSAASAASLS